MAAASEEPPWRVVEKKDGSGIERPPEEETPWAPIAQQLEKQLEEAPPKEQPSPEDCEAARQLLAAARQAQAKAWKEEGWSRLAELEAPPDEDEGDARRQRVPALASWEEGGAAAASDGEERLLCMKNYAAVDAEAGSYGLIDRGVREAGIRTLVMHVPRTRRGARDKQGRLLPAAAPPALVRPGTVLRVRPTAGRGGAAARLRVRYTTPARYYSPGEHVTTLCVGVDASDWQALLRSTSDAPVRI
jgi:hypothetical protein